MKVFVWGSKINLKYFHHQYWARLKYWVLDSCQNIQIYFKILQGSSREDFLSQFYIVVCVVQFGLTFSWALKRCSWADCGQQPHGQVQSRQVLQEKPRSRSFSGLSQYLPWALSCWRTKLGNVWCPAFTQQPVPCSQELIFGESF